MATKMIALTVDGIPTTIVDDNGKFYIHLRPRFELHLKPLIINRDFLKQPPH